MQNVVTDFVGMPAFHELVRFGVSQMKLSFGHDVDSLFELNVSYVVFVQNAQFINIISSRIPNVYSKIDL